jgi:hypothetical protein
VARVLEPTIERDSENGFAAKEKSLPGALNSLLEEIPVRRNAHGGGEQMREMVRAQARNGGDRCKPQIIGEMRVNEIDRAAQTRIESDSALRTIILLQR